jgi:hypothetical protein
MTSRYRHRRTSSASTPFPNPIEPGEIAVNTANRQLAVGDASSGGVGTPLPFLGVRIFSNTAIYLLNDLATFTGMIYRAKVNNGPGEFDLGNWEPASAHLLVSDNAPSAANDGSLWWDSTEGVLYVRYRDADGAQWVIASPQPDIDSLVRKSGDAMTGRLTLSADPVNAMHAATKQYSDAASNNKVLRAGDTMTGNLAISKVSPLLTLETPAPGQDMGIRSVMNSKLRWSMQLGNGTPESGGNAGANFVINRYGDDGVFISAPLYIVRSSGDTTIAHNAYINGGVFAGAAGNAGTYYFGNSGTKYLTYDGTSFALNGGNLLVNGTIQLGTGGTVIGNSSIELGQPAVAYTPFIDFHSSGTSNDWDARIICNGGTATAGKGTLALQAGVLNLNSIGHFKWMPADTLAGSWYDSINGADRFFVGADSVADQWRVYAAGGGNALQVNYNGTVTIPGALTVGSFSGTTDGSIMINSSGYARFRSISAGVRDWKFGAASNGSWVITDESAGAFRFNIDTGGTVSINGGLTCGTTAEGVQGVYGKGFHCKQGLNGGYEGNWFNTNWNGIYIWGWINTSQVGYMPTPSDYRIKKDVIDLPGMWDTVKNLRPIKFSQQEFSPPSHVEYIASERSKLAKLAEDPEAPQPTAQPNLGPLFINDDNERWGFIAHELQDTLTMSAASGVKDSPNIVQCPEPMTIIAALTKALQEAMTRIEALEAAAQPARRRA